MKILLNVSKIWEVIDILYSPMYLVSPQLLVTSEHIISDNSSTASSFSFDGSAGEVTEPRGVGSLSICGVLCGDSRFRGWLPDFEDLGVPALLWLYVLSVSLFSSVPKSVLSSSSLPNSPESFSRDSILPRRFSSPSMYFALGSY